MPEGVKPRLPEERQKELTWAATVVSQAQGTGFYGEILLKFEGGVIRRVLKTESLYPPDSNGKH